MSFGACGRCVGFRNGFQLRFRNVFHVRIADGYDFDYVLRTVTLQLVQRSRREADLKD